MPPPLPLPPQRLTDAELAASVKANTIAGIAGVSAGAVACFLTLLAVIGFFYLRRARRMRGVRTGGAGRFGAGEKRLVQTGDVFRARPLERTSSSGPAGSRVSPAPPSSNAVGSGASRSPHPRRTPTVQTSPPAEVVVPSGRFVGWDDNPSRRPRAKGQPEIYAKYASPLVIRCL